jgi:hypothetical protein
VLRARSHRQILAGLVVLAIVLAVPLTWRVVLRIWGPSTAAEQPSYLPALEARRPRAPFLDVAVSDLRRLNPDYVLIGDSMAGRLDPVRLTELSQGVVAPLLHAASGPALWYLVLKNYVIPSGITPKWVFVFFRDTNLTDVTFRLDGPYRYQLDPVAHDAEPELDAVIGARLRGGWRRVHALADSAYDITRARALIEPALTNWPARMLVNGQAAELLDRINQVFALENQRTMAQADMAAADAPDANFHAFVDASVLPLMLELAGAHDLRLVFVRVLRRPIDGQPPPETPELQQYVRDLRAYIEARGGVLLDDRDNPELAELPYSDGDHLGRAARQPYTDFFWERLQRLHP